MSNCSSLLPARPETLHDLEPVLVFLDPVELSVLPDPEVHFQGKSEYVSSLGVENIPEKFLFYFPLLECPDEELAVIAGDEIAIRGKDVGPDDHILDVDPAGVDLNEVKHLCPPRE